MPGILFMETFSHPFHDIEIERVEPAVEVHLIKILSIDGRRFTYELHGRLDEDAVAYIETVIDAAVFGDMRIERTPEGFNISESASRLKKHS